MSHIITLISHPETPQIGDEVIGAVADKLNRAIDVTWLDPMIACDFKVFETELPAVTALSPFFDKTKIDIAIQNETGRRKSILLADMDSTMIEQECIDELADAIAIKEKVANITARAMRGEIDFEPALRERVGLLEGLNLEIIDDVMANNITLRSGGRTLVQTMKANGGYTALVSGGFTMFTEKVAVALGFDENRANTLLSSNGSLTGKVAEPILGSAAKQEALLDIAKQRGLSTKDVMAVGDGANDLAMIKLAGSGVALHAKPKVAREADIAINHGDLTALLFLQGYKRREFIG